MGDMHNILSGGIVSAKKAAKLAELYEAFRRDPDVKTFPTHVISDNGNNDIFYVSFDGRHLLGFEGTDVILFLSKQPLKAVKEIYKTEIGKNNMKGNSGDFKGILTGIAAGYGITPKEGDKTEAITRAILDAQTEQSEYNKKYGAEDEEIIKSALNGGEIKRTHRDGTKVNYPKIINDITAPPTYENIPVKGGNYARILQGTGVNAISRVSSKSFTEIDKFTGSRTAIFTGGVDGIKVIQEETAIISALTQQVLAVFMLKLAENFPAALQTDKELTAEELLRYSEITVTLREYMELRGLKDVKSAREQLNKEVEKLYNLSVEWTEKRHETYTTKNGRKRKKIAPIKWEMRLLSAAEKDAGKVKNGRVKIKISPEIAYYFYKAGAPMWYNKALLTIDAKKCPHAVYIGRKILEHYNLNFAKNNENRISVKTLLEYCPDLPKYEDITQKGRQVTERIIRPFERALKELEKTGFLLKWQYERRGKGDVPDVEAVAYTYEFWKEWIIVFELADYPDQTERVQKIEEARKEKERKRKNAKRRAARKEEKDER